MTEGKGTGVGAGQGSRSGGESGPEAVSAGGASSGGTGLAGSASPFLRHGATQPVNWLPWGEAAFDRARADDRPILLDIGAVWCHWCHVMDRESYEDPDTAALINELYVPVKVDRDERPDVDARYQRAVQSLVGQGGWPLTGFLTPDGRVFHGGTYFPPEDAHGRPSFRRVLREVARVWTDERNRAEQAAAAVTERLTQTLAAEAAAGPLEPGLLDQAEDAFTQSYDPRHGGFGGAPKFPSTGGLAFLLDRWLDGGAALNRDMVETTLGAMVSGGIHDHLGGGFHRYSTDARWIIPHFEKMAYDNGPLLEVLARAAVAMDRDDFRAAAAGVVAYYRDVAGALVEAGGFPASQDADIGPDDDGDHWTWTRDEMEEALAGAPDGAAKAALLHWGLGDPAGSMHLDPDRHVLFQAMAVDDIARRMEREPAEIEALLAEARKTLRAVRSRRPRPFVDETFYTGWVALVASGHIAAARHLGLEGAGRDGIRALERIWKEAWTDGVGVAHRIPDTGSGVFLADQAYLLQALLDAFEWTQADRWLQHARDVVAVIRGRFRREEGGLRDLPFRGDARPGALAQDRLEITDSPEPSPTAVTARSMLRLAALDHDDDLAADARRLLSAYAGSAPRFATSAATFFHALRWAVGPVTTVVVVEKEGSLTAAALHSYRPATVVRRIDPSSAATGDADVPDPVRAMLTGASPRAYVCTGPQCHPPVSTAEDLRSLLRTDPT